MENNASNITFITIFINLLLSLLKGFAGVFAHSSAMISDAIHSASDIFSSLIVLVGLHYSQKESDLNHPYGHERFECVAALVLSVILALTGLLIGQKALALLFSSQPIAEIPGSLAVIAAVCSIVIKEAMYWYTRFYALRFDSGALMADAWHHRSDALSSIGSLIGIQGARMGFPQCDSLASLIICLFILKAAFDIFKDAVNKMIDHKCDDKTEAEIKNHILHHSEVLAIDSLQTRVFANRIYIDLEICIDSSLSLTQAHDIAEKIHHSTEQKFPKVKHIMIHVNPSQSSR